MMDVVVLHPEELRAKLERKDPLLLLDVRELEEVQICSLGGKHIPLGDLPHRMSELDPEKEIVVICHHGIRSAHAAGYLKQQGYARICNLSGGIDAWARDIDPSMARY